MTSGRSRRLRSRVARWLNPANTQSPQSPMAPSGVPATVLELRVHGVHGTPPQSMLGVTASDTLRVAGDGITGVYRTKDGKVPLRTLRHPANDAPVERQAAVEAYSWAGLTSSARGLFGWVTRALWLGLLPFALANLAYWARPEIDFRRNRGDLGEQERRAALSGASLVRLGALVLTVLLVQTPLTVGVDLVARQCFRGGDALCPALPGILGFLASDWFDASPGRRIAVGMLPALAVILVLWILSGTSLARYEAVSRRPQPGTGDAAESEISAAEAVKTVPLVLQHPSLWSGTYRTRRLRDLHTIAALCSTVCFTSAAVLFGEHADIAALEPTNSTGGLAYYGVIAVLGVIAVVGLVASAARTMAAGPGDIECNDDLPAAPERRSRRRRLKAGVAGAAALVVLLLGRLLWVPKDVADAAADLGEDAIYGANVWFVADFVLLVGLTTVLALIGRLSLPVARSVGLLMGVLLVLSSGYLVSGQARRGTHWWDQGLWPAWVAYGALALVVALWIFVQRTRRRARRYSKPAEVMVWRGSGPAVLLGAATWVALLFTTAAVTLAADFVNGGQGVDDLGIQTTKTQVAQSTSDAPREFIATGAVTIIGADIRVEGGEGEPARITVSSGGLEVGALRRVDDPEASSLARVALDGSVLQLRDARTVAYTQSICVDAVGRPCAGTTAATGVDSDPSSVRGDGTLLAVGEDGGSGVIAGPAQPAPTDAAGTVTVTAHVPAQAIIELPQVLAWALIGQLVLVLVSVIPVVRTWRRARTREIVNGIRESVTGDARIAPEDLDSCVNARVRALLPHRAEELVGGVAVVGSVVSIAVLLGALTGDAPGELVQPGWSREALRLLYGGALWVALGSALALVWFGSRLRTSDEDRKTAGILWDLTSFWPRAAHPLAPPCYAERVVPELIQRIKWALTTPEDRVDDRPGRHAGGASTVVVSGHSQGSALAVAALSRLEDRYLTNVRLVTYGSQLRQWYGRVFPAVFSSDSLGYSDTGAAQAGRKEPPAPASLRARLGTGAAGDERAWVNLFRATDPIGFRVFGDVGEGGDDIFVLEVPHSSHGDPGPEVMSHSGYQHSPEYLAVLRSWTGEDEPDLARPPAHAPPFLPEP